MKCEINKGKGRQKKRGGVEIKMERGKREQEECVREILYTH